MADVNFDRLLELRKQVEQHQDQAVPPLETRYRLKPNEGTQFSYRDGYPLKVVLRQGGSEEESVVLEVGRLEDLGIEAQPNVGFVILDKKLLTPEKGLVGVKGLRDNETVPIGRAHLKGRFIFPPSISRNHAEISREDVETATGKQTYITVKDLGSSLGTSVIVTAPAPDFSTTP